MHGFGVDVETIGGGIGFGGAGLMLVASIIAHNATNKIIEIYMLRQ